MGYRQKGIVKRADLEGQIEDVEVMPITWDECVLIGRTKPLSEVFTPKGGGVKENQVLAVAAVDDNGNPVAWKYTDGGGSSSGGKDYRIAETPSGEYAKSYKLQFKGEEDEEWSDAPESFVINVPKDMVVESGSVKTCTEADTPVQGYEVGDKYIDLVIANKADAHIYINVKDLVNNAADGISYDTTESGLEAENVQEALDELAENKADKTEISNVVKAPQTAEVGQVLSVKAVDEEGRPTEWECVNQSGGGDRISGFYTMGQLALPTSLTSQRCIVDGNELYIFGSDKLVYKWDGNVWTKLPDSYAAFCRGGCEKYKGKIYLYGGENASSYLQIFDGKSWTYRWINEINNNGYGYNANMVIYNDELHVIDSYSHIKYDGSNWTNVSQLPYSNMTRNKICFYNNEIHIFGGDTNRKAHYKWNGGNSWTFVSTLPDDMYNYNALYTLDDGIHIVFNTGHYIWNEKTGMWTKSYTIDYNDTNNSCIIKYDNRIYIVGSRGTRFGVFKDGQIFSNTINIFTDY